MNLGLIRHEDVCFQVEAHTPKPLFFSSQKLLLIIVTTDYKVFNMGRNNSTKIFKSVDFIFSDSFTRNTLAVTEYLRWQMSKLTHSI